MALDGIFLNNLITDLKEYLVDSKIDKINQPEKDEIILSLRKNRTNFKLLISASSQFSRMHITNMQKENPLKAPLYLMVLRKYLVSGIITDVTQKSNDRIVTLHISSRDELGFDSKYSLIVEIMGRHSNITLVRERDMKVMESIKHITPDINSFRVLYPGVTYVYPPESLKLNPFNFSKDELINAIKDYNNIIDENFFFKNFTGISKPLSKELYFNLSNFNYNLKEEERLYKFVTNLFENIKNNPSFYIYVDNNGIFKDFHSLDFKTFDEKYTKLHYSNPSEMLDKFYYMRDKQERLHSRSQDLQKLIHTNIERCNKKEKILNNTLEDCSKKDFYKVNGDLLTSYVYSFKKGDSSVVVQNFYDENLENVEIKINPNKTPSENIQIYYKKYNKLKKAEEEAYIQLEKNEMELEYLNSVLTNILNAESYDEIEEIKKELMETGYLRFKKSSLKKKSKSKPLHFVSSEGIDIYVGKNNLQNDHLSLKFANKNYIWMHAKDMPGSHVIICSTELLDKTIEEAAVLAAYYSKAKNTSKVPIDYTLVKNLKKPNGAKPGMVIYHTNWSMLAEPKNLSKLDIKKL
ncbi:NFACT RNA binding domain-containing protein [Clostridium baratii]|uniref:Rqc2 family fibronectin-binding protein n=1 Tax=Clostridium baratii TaxID=1561 RepID=UPI002902D23B|nr:NFACT RNA binding domain-containing protein [Clostridium baratii]MDU1053389.1 NFACT RNA binding domain-containing protein [Clostridium baratii]